MVAKAGICLVASRPQYREPAYDSKIELTRLNPWGHARPVVRGLSSLYNYMTSLRAAPGVSSIDPVQSASWPYLLLRRSATVPRNEPEVGADQHCLVCAISVEGRVGSRNVRRNPGCW